MKIVTRYITKQLVLGFVLITTGMMAIVWLSQSLRLMEILVNSSASILLFIQLTLLMVPGYLAVVSPLSLFTITLFTYNRLITDRELIVLGTSGMSPLQLAKPVLIIGTIATILGFYVSLELVPESIGKFKTMRWRIQNDISHLLFQEGEFSDIALGVTLYVRHKNTDGSLGGIILYDQRPKSGPTTLLAEKGVLSYKGGIPQVLMENGSRQEVNAHTGRFSILFFDSYTFDFSSLSTPDIGLKNAGEMTLAELFIAANKPPIFRENVRRYNVEAYKRLTQPFYNFSFMLIAAVGLLTGTFNRRGHTGRVLATVFAMAFVQVVSLSIENLALRSPYFVPLMFLFAILPIYLCLYLLKNAGKLPDLKLYLQRMLAFFKRWIESRRAHA